MMPVISRARWALLAVLCGCAFGEVPGERSADGVEVAPLEITSLGVMGFLIRSGNDAVLTAPLFSNPSLWKVSVGDVASDPAAVDKFTTGVRLDDVRAILSGHAHYDHLMDVPFAWRKTPRALILGNRSMRHILAAYAPDRAPSCGTTAPPPVEIPRHLVYAFDGPPTDIIDRRPCGGPDASPGGWFWLNGSPIRIRALCSQHPAQFLGYHHGAGEVTEDQCQPPASAEEWREGQTLTYLIDFLDPETYEPRHRIYYQDAPTDAPVGLVPEDVLAEKEVDVALLCVGTFANVRLHPTEAIESMKPRYVLSGHWEDFFRPQDQPIVAVPFHDLALYDQRAEAALATTHEDRPATVDGVETTARHFRPLPRSVFTFPAR